MDKVKAFRKAMKRDYPHLKISVRKVSFSDLARGEAYRVSVGPGATVSDLHWINKSAKEAGILPDQSVRTFAKETYHA